MPLGLCRNIENQNYVLGLSSRNVVLKVLCFWTRIREMKQRDLKYNGKKTLCK